MRDFVRTDHYFGPADPYRVTMVAPFREQMTGAGGPVALQLAAGLDQAINKFHLSAGSERKGRLQSPANNK